VWRYPDGEVSRLPGKIRDAHLVLDRAIEEYDPVAVCGLTSGGNDSTVLLHVMRPFLTHAVHINTETGVPQTTEYVRRMTRDLGLELIERTPPEGRGYRDLVLGRVPGYAGGFPGPKMHPAMYQKLKEAALRRVRAELLEGHARDARVIFVTGVRQDESARRFRNTNATGEVFREGRLVWVSPIKDFTNSDMSEYRRRYSVPRNEVSDHLHMSGECLCGAYAKRDEIEQIEFFFPEVAQRLRHLEHEVKEAWGRGELQYWKDGKRTGKIVDVKVCQWGWAKNEPITEEDLEGLGILCSACKVSA
jgi:3'-phosphoadenosine 5'-phosphosulfate sulfotransferase (PAPS reductase)/FAD synthetase